MDDSLNSRFRRAFWRAFHEADSIRLRQWERSHVTLPQLRVLYHLRRRPGATTGELARRLGITVSTTSGLVIKLVDRGLVVRGSLADDRRQAPLTLSEAGAALLGELSDEARSFMSDVTRRLGPDLEAVTTALELLAAAAPDTETDVPDAGPHGRAPVGASADTKGV
ncbi:MAG: MarR family transcriptional regulator [Chloroflexota bacterium]